MKKVHINLNSSINLHQGVAVYSSEIISRMIKHDGLEFEGGACFYKSDEIESARRFGISTKIARVPMKLVFESKHAKHFPFKSYNKLVHSHADIFVFTGNDLPKGGIKVNGKKVLVIHDIIPLYRAWEDPEKARIYYCDKLTETKEADVIIAVSEFTKKELIRYFGCPADKIRVVYNGVNFESFNTPAPQSLMDECRKKYNLPPKFMMYMGSAGKYKNIEGILRAYALLPDDVRASCKVVIANTRPDLNELADSLGISKDVYLLHGVDEKYKVPLYQMSCILLQVSFYEGFGIPLIEGMAAGKPVIAANATCLPEVVGDAGLLADPNSPEDIAEKMLILLQDKKLYDEMVQKGYERAKKFNWDKSAEDFIQVLKEM